MEHSQVATILNTLAKSMAENSSRTFNYTILVNNKTNGGLYRLTGNKKVIVHPDRVASGVLLHVIVEELFSLIEAKTGVMEKLRKKSIKDYKASGEEAIEYLRSHLSSDDFQVWVEDTVGLV